MKVLFYLCKLVSKLFASEAGLGEQRRLILRAELGNFVWHVDARGTYSVLSRNAARYSFIDLNICKLNEQLVCDELDRRVNGRFFRCFLVVSTLQRAGIQAMKSSYSSVTI